MGLCFQICEQALVDTPVEIGCLYHGVWNHLLHIMGSNASFLAWVPVSMVFGVFGTVACAGSDDAPPYGFDGVQPDTTGAVTSSGTVNATGSAASGQAAGGTVTTAGSASTTGGVDASANTAGVSATTGGGFGSGGATSTDGATTAGTQSTGAPFGGMATTGSAGGASSTATTGGFGNNSTTGFGFGGGSATTGGNATTGGFTATSTTGSGTTGGSSASFSEVAAMIEQTCASSNCHGGRERPSLSNNGNLLNTLMNTTVRQCGGSALVAPNNSSGSALMSLLQGTCGNFIMPPTCTAPPCMSDQDMTTISTWIDAGAPAN